jgi:hypothetical protein
MPEAEPVALESDSASMPTDHPPAEIPPSNTRLSPV